MARYPAFLGYYGTTPQAEKEAEEKAARERELALEMLEGGVERYTEGHPLIDPMRQMTMDTLTGKQMPYTPEIVNQMVGQRTGSATVAARESEQDLMKRLASRGMLQSGSASAGKRKIQAGRRASVQQGRTEIGLRAALQNWNARERAGASAMQQISGEAGATGPLRGQAAELRAGTEYKAKEGWNFFK